MGISGVALHILYGLYSLYRPLLIEKNKKQYFAKNKNAHRVTGSRISLHLLQLYLQIRYYRVYGIKNKAAIIIALQCESNVKLI